MAADGNSRGRGFVVDGPQRDLGDTGSTRGPRLPEPLAIAGTWMGAAVISVLLLALILNFTGNRSPGALDNGSGIGSLLELARTWRPRPDAPADVVFVATGAEEAGLDGARHFLKMHDAWWFEKPTLLINLESVGAGPRLYLAGHHASLRLAHAIAGQLGLPHLTLACWGGNGPSAFFRGRP